MRRDLLLLSPVIVVQAFWVAARAARLPEATGARQGTMGEGRDTRVLIIGDSSAAGVGVANQDQALAGQLSTELAGHVRVSWQLIAKSGATAASTLAKLDVIAPEKTDLVVLALGVNDTKNGVSLRAWEARYATLLDRIAEMFAPARVCVSGVPPLADFPILPWPLRDVLGQRALLFDESLRRLCDQRPEALYVPMQFDMDPSHMASDGFHPGAAIYREWAQRIADLWRDDFV